MKNSCSPVPAVVNIKQTETPENLLQFHMEGSPSVKKETTMGAFAAQSS